MAVGAAGDSREDAARDRLIAEATARFLRLRTDPADPAGRADLARWLAASPRHGEVWRALERTWRATGLLGPLAAPQSAPSPVRRPARPSKRGRRLTAFALAASLALGIGALVGGPLWPGADYRAGAAGIAAIVLEDGSRVRLDAGSALDVAYGPDRRDVALRDGPAFFEVEPDTARPFVVRAGAVEVTVTGTAFAIDVSASEVGVSVEHGGVRVVSAGRSALLAPGERMRIAKADGAVVRDRVPLSAIGSWRRGRLLVEDRALSEVVEAVERHFAGAIILGDDAMAGQRVTGVFDLGDPERALRAAVEPLGGKIRRLGPWLLMVSGPSDPR
ncbi:iron dicitrate transport regulator FecR [Rhodospirillum rubrum]|uniref:FecR family protein n=1 Tax=Rhodospirillum rubrum TaxID=1085 RepID=UPI001904F811|nr:FecR domain-containing protein [Rhodospirillum rubrum]MBK1663800.1 iron dicitrate transport regulator FecR [Rhodospirillum rubrum]MBK1675861.1 iron dicitrate transport regulator FecR [Rhodospirillum rubrum]